MKKSFFLLTIATINDFELWLQNKAINGWVLTKKKGWLLEFEEGEKKPREYFVYLLADKNDLFLYDFYRVTQKYKKKKSKLRNISVILEVDEKKIDDDYLRYIYSRNQYYMKQSIKFMIFSMLLFILSLGSSRFFWLGVILGIIFLNSVITFFLIKKGSKKRLQKLQKKL